MSQASLSIPIDSIRRLPKDAEYRAKSGQANAVVKIQNDTIIVFAICDSLQRRSEYFESETRRYKEALEELSTQYDEVVQQMSNPPYPLKKVLTAFIIGLIIGGIIMMFIKFKFR